MITVTVLTKDSERYLHGVLLALKPFDEVLLLDSGSTDGTLEIAEQFSNVTIHHHEFEGFGPQHNVASELAKNDWILSVDSDEVLSKELADEILSLSLEEQTVYGFSRHTYYNDKLIKWCGWYPDYIFRLYNRKVTCFSDAQVHERIVTDGLKEQLLKGSMRHYSYETTTDFLAKMQSYSTLFAKQHKGQKQSSLCKALLHGSFAFIKSYFLRLGFLGGKEGFIISVYNANTAFYKYLKLAEENRLIY